MRALFPPNKRQWRGLVRSAAIRSVFGTLFINLQSANHRLSLPNLRHKTFSLLCLRKASNFFLFYFSFTDRWYTLIIDVFIYLHLLLMLESTKRVGREREVWRSLVTSFREWGEGTLADFINSLRGLRPTAEITSHPIVHTFLIANFWYY
jgi:hypothetical protein